MLRRKIYWFTIGIAGLSQISIAEFFNVASRRHFGGQDDCAVCRNPVQVGFPSPLAGLPLHQDLRSRLNGFVNGDALGAVMTPLPMPFISVQPLVPAIAPLAAPPASMAAQYVPQLGPQFAAQFMTRFVGSPVPAGTPYIPARSFGYAVY